MFEDIEARRCWRRYRLKTELLLGAVAGDVRSQLIEDLSAHVREVIAHGDPNRSELARLKSALERIGEPSEFLAPLVGDAVMRARPRTTTGWRAVLAQISLGGERMARAAGIAAAGAAGAIAMTVAIGALIAPDRIGVFRAGPDEFQIRILGLTGAGGDRVLWPWVEFVIGSAGALLLRRAGATARRLLVDILSEK